MAAVAAVVLALTMAMTVSAEGADARKLDALYSLAVAYIGRENYDKAMDYLNGALELCDESNSELYSDIHLKKGCVYTIRKDYASAQEELDEAIRVTPDMSEAYLVKTQIFSETGDNAKAAESLEKYIELSGNVEIYETLAQLYSQSGDSENSLRAYQAFLDATQVKGTEAVFSVAEYKMEHGMYDEAIAEYESVLDDQVYGKAAAYNIGVCQLKKEDYTSALSSFKTCLENEAVFDGIYYNIGICNMMLNNAEEAIEAFGQAIDSGSYRKDTLYNRAISYIALDQSKAAADDLTAYLNLAKEEAEKAAAEQGAEAQEFVDTANYYRGVCWLSLGENEKAEADFALCIANGIEKAASSYYLARIELEAGKNEQAKADFTASIEGGISLADARYYRAIARLYLGDNEDALADLTFCIDNGYNLGEAYYQRAQIYQVMGDEDKYLADLEASLDY